MVPDTLSFTVFHCMLKDMEWYAGVADRDVVGVSSELKQRQFSSHTELQLLEHIILGLLDYSLADELQVQQIPSAGGRVVET